MAGRASRFARRYLGLDSSTQSLSAVAIEVAGDGPANVAFETSLNFDQTLPHYGTRYGVLPRTDPASAHSSPVMWAEALDVMLARLGDAGAEPARLAAISGAAQQHGSVYLKAGAATRTGAARSLPASRPTGGAAALAPGRPHLARLEHVRIVRRDRERGRRRRRPGGAHGVAGV